MDLFHAIALTMTGDKIFLPVVTGGDCTKRRNFLNYRQEPISSYSLYSDFFWYEIGDVICIGNDKVQYYCFPQNCGDVVAKARLACEELYKLMRQGAEKKEERRK